VLVERVEREGPTGRIVDDHRLGRRYDSSGHRDHDRLVYDTFIFDLR
jgi:hypothetical protein